MNFWSAFKESDGMYSAARVAFALTISISCAVLVYVVIKNHSIPDAMTLFGLASFGCSPYCLNKGFTAFAKKDAQL